MKPYGEIYSESKWQINALCHVDPSCTDIIKIFCKFCNVYQYHKKSKKRLYCDNRGQKLDLKSLSMEGKY